MIIVKIYGGLGNQLFQYAAAKNLGLKFNHEVYIDKSWYDNIPKSNTIRSYLLDKFSLNEGYLNIKYGNIFSKIIPFIFFKGKLFKIIDERNVNKVSNKGHYILNDYWQSIDYFIDNNQLILNSFHVKSISDVTINQLLVDIKNQNSVAIHVRRGDYLTNKFATLKHGVCSMEYYLLAINRIYLTVNNPFFYIFSDDITWAKENFSFIKNKIFIDNASQDMPISDFILMSNCKNHIIANSSFSWWSAWIAWSKNTSGLENLVIAPKKWFINEDPDENLFPSSWVII